MKSYSSAAVLLVGLAGCTPEVWSVERFDRPRTGGLTRASFELECPKDQLQVVELATMTIGVTGCGKRAVYKWVEGTGWVNNTGVDDHRAAEKK